MTGEYQHVTWFQCWGDGEGAVSAVTEGGIQSHVTPPPPRTAHQPNSAHVMSEVFVRDICGANPGTP